MSPSRALLSVAACVALGLPLTADAGHVVLTPLVASKGVKPEQVQDIFTLMSSELEFMDGVDGVIEIASPPPSLNAACLSNTACLSALAREHKGDALLTGAIELRSGELLVDLLYFDAKANRVLRRKTHAVPAEASALVDRMTPILAEAITGVDPQQEAKRKESASFSAASDDFAFEEERRPAPVPVAAAKPVPSGASASGTARAVDRPLTAPVAPAPAPAPRPAPQPAPQDDFDPNAFSFGSSADEISFGGDAAPTVRPAPVDRFVDDEDYGYGRDDLDGLSRGSSRGTQGRSATTSGSRTSGGTAQKAQGVTGWRRVHVPLRAGYANFGDFSFFSIGGELQVRVYEGLFIGAGASGYLARYCGSPPSGYEGPTAPAALCGVEGKVVKPANLVPLHLGFAYRFMQKRVQPYAGADLQVLSIGRFNGVNTMSVGARARLGLDIFFARNVGLNIDAGAGFWSGQGWTLLPEPRPQPRTGFVPHVTGGLVVAF